MYRRLIPLLLLMGAARAAEPPLPAEVSVYRPDDTTLVLRWHAQSGQPGSVEITQGGAKVGIPARNVGNDYHATLSDLPPNSEVRFVLRPYGDQEASREHVYYTRPPAGSLETRTLPLLAVAYTPIHYSDAEEGKPLPAGTPARLTEQDLAAIRRQLEGVREFYFRATHGRLNLVWDLEAEATNIGNRPSLDAGDVTPPFEATMDRVLKERKRGPDYYAGAVFMFGWTEGLSAETRTGIYRDQAFSGGTYGTDGPWKFKRMPYTMINFNRGADIRWTVTHEFGHQLDSMADFSGYPSLAFNHPDPMTEVGVFGEHWDANWWLHRKFPRDNWTGLNFGTRRVSADADGDGLADDDPFLPMDEKRLGSDPAKKDTDGDGLSDLAEYTATMGITAGLNERMGGPIVTVNPRVADSDRDGRLDGNDPYPQYPVTTMRRYTTPRLDGVWRDGEWQVAGAVNTPPGATPADAMFGLQWDDRYLYVAMRSSRPMDFAVDLDAMNDGWFTGTDNYRLMFSAPTGETAEPAVSSTIWDWSVFDHTAERNPYLSQSKDIVKPEDLYIAHGRDGGQYVLEVAIPFNYKTGLRLYDGKRLGVRLGARLPGSRQLLTVFEPHHLMEMQLWRAY